MIIIEVVDDFPDSSDSVFRASFCFETHGNAGYAACNETNNRLIVLNTHKL